LLSIAIDVFVKIFGGKSAGVAGFLPAGDSARGWEGSDFTFFGCAGDGVEGSGWTGFVASMAGAATAALVSNIWLEGERLSPMLVT